MGGSGGPTPAEMAALLRGEPVRPDLDLDDGNRLLKPSEVASLFRVDPKTVTRWAAAGRLTSILTPGGHRRFRTSEVRALLGGTRKKPGAAA